VVSAGTVFFLPAAPVASEGGRVRAGVSWESVLRIDGMIKLMLEIHRVLTCRSRSVSMPSASRDRFRARGAGLSH